MHIFFTRMDAKLSTSCYLLAFKEPQQLAVRYDVLMMIRGLGNRFVFDILFLEEKGGNYSST